MLFQVNHLKCLLNEGAWKCVWRRDGEKKKGVGGGGEKGAVIFRVKFWVLMVNLHEKATNQPTNQTYIHNKTSTICCIILLFCLASLFSFHETNI